jgi:hypothetical protein
MIIRIVYNIKNPQFHRKIQSEANLLVPQYINRSVTKNFLIETLSKMIHSSTINLGDVEYDKQNGLKISKNLTSVEKFIAKVTIFCNCV